MAFTKEELKLYTEKLFKAYRSIPREATVPYTKEQRVSLDSINTGTAGKGYRNMFVPAGLTPHKDSDASREVLFAPVMFDEPSKQNGISLRYFSLQKKESMTLGPFESPEEFLNALSTQEKSRNYAFVCTMLKSYTSFITDWDSAYATQEANIVPEDRDALRNKPLFNISDDSFGEYAFVEYMEDIIINPYFYAVPMLRCKVLDAFSGHAYESFSVYTPGCLRIYGQQTPEHLSEAISICSKSVKESIDEQKQIIKTIQQQARHVH